MTTRLMHDDRDNPGQKVVRIYTLTPCEPCEIIKDAVKLIETPLSEHGWSVKTIDALSSDKKSLGRSLLAGVTRFPTVKLIIGGEVKASFVSVLPDWTATHVAKFLIGEIEKLDEPTNYLPNNAVRHIINSHSARD